MKIFGFVIVFAFGMVFAQALGPKQRSPEEILLTQFQTAGDPDNDFTFIRQTYLQVNRLTQQDARLAVAEYVAYGCIKHNKTAEYIQVLKDFSDLELDLSDLEVLCQQCDGTGGKEIDCPECEGDRSCRLCEGRGVRVVKSIREQAMVERPCTKCNQTGRCANCNGKGFFTSKCLSCAGKGKTLNLDLIQTRQKAARAKVMKALSEN